jgi:hypothetical protein
MGTREAMHVWDKGKRELCTFSIFCELNAALQIKSISFEKSTRKMAARAQKQTV